MALLEVLTHGTAFVAGAFLSESVRPLVAGAGRVLRPVAKNAIRETMLARRGLQAIASEARAEIDGGGELRTFPGERHLIDE
jgi:hypothetical protein